MSIHWVPKAGNGWRRVNIPGLEAFEGFLLTTCFWEQGLLFHDKTPFRVSPKLCYGLSGGNCILCLNALMFIWNGYVQVSLMLYSLKIIKLHNWIIKFVSPLEAVPECPFQSAVLRALHSVHGNSPGRNTGVNCHSFLQRIFPTQGLNLGLLHCRHILYPLGH